MVNNILLGLWYLFMLAMVCGIVSVTVMANVFLGLRLTYFYKNYKDPINAFKRKSDDSSLIASLENEKEYQKINGF